ncbi:TPA_asm: hypothetical protein [Porphyromonas phage phage029a_Kyudai3]|uniref:Uncharacterized protein n=1 Tax=Porphyromonas phage phage029a_Kyudai3 TaxID=3154119 RepID=A0AAT9J984_9CAUD
MKASLPHCITSLDYSSSMITYRSEVFPSWALLPTVCIRRVDSEMFWRLEVALIFLRYSLLIYFSKSIK